MSYGVIIAQNVLDRLAEESESLAEKFFTCVELLGSFPEIGGEYTPQDGDDEPPIPCRYYHIPDTYKTIYYGVDYERREAKVFALIDQRRNPSYRFRETRQSD